MSYLNIGDGQFSNVASPEPGRIYKVFTGDRADVRSHSRDFAICDEDLLNFAVLRKEGKA